MYTPAEQALFDALREQYKHICHPTFIHASPEEGAKISVDEVLYDLKHESWKSHLWRSNFLGNENELIENICKEQGIKFDPLWMTPNFQKSEDTYEIRLWTLMRQETLTPQEEELKALLEKADALEDALTGRRLALTIGAIRELEMHLDSRGALATWRELQQIQWQIRTMINS